MKLYVKTPAPSVLKVLIFTDECGRELDEVEVQDLKSREFLEINPFGTVPVLETDEGQRISESLTICHYLESIWKSGLFGREDAERIDVEQWERRADLRLYTPAIEYVHQMHPMFAGRIEQQPEWAMLLAARAQESAAIFSAQLDQHRFVAGERFSMADITAYLGVSAFLAFRAIDHAQLPGLRRWSEEVGARRSMERLQALLA